VDKGDLAAKQAASENLRRAAEKARDSEDVPAGWMRPPTALYFLASNELGNIGNWSMGRLEQDALLVQSLECLGASHRPSVLIVDAPGVSAA
jgi:hypothetical protein